MRERLIQLAEIATAIALTAATLGSMLYLANSTRRVGQTSEAAIPARPAPPQPEAIADEGPATASQLASKVTYLSLDELRARCVEEVRQPAAPAGGDSFCSLYARVTRRQEQQVASAPAVSPVAAPTETQREAPERTYPVLVDDCRRLGYGSIAYRNCRADEAKRLSKGCNERRSRLNLVGFSASDDERGWMRAWCHEADRYQIVD